MHLAVSVHYCFRVYLRCCFPFLFHCIDFLFVEKMLVAPLHWWPDWSWTRYSAMMHCTYTLLHPPRKINPSQKLESHFTVYLPLSINQDSIFPNTLFPVSRSIIWLFIHASFMFREARYVLNRSGTCIMRSSKFFLLCTFELYLEMWNSKAPLCFWY